MLLSSKGKHRRPSKAVRFAAFAGITGAAVAAPLMGATSASAATSAEWDQVAQCESGGNWSINTGNGYYGGLQFNASTWAAYGGTQYASSADQASKSQQIEIAEKVLANQGKGAWPSCGVGLSGASAGGSSDSGSSGNSGSGNSGSNSSNSSNGSSGGGSAQQSAPKQESQETAQAQPKKAETRSSDSGAASRSQSRTVVKKGDGEYKVKSGDTLGKIAKAEHVEGGWQKLYELNKDVVPDANLIYPGQQLHLS
ncbi:LysM peptidoglycan-binding domain-containing protein [Streptomyces sp. LP05-1]|uniref:LysM peptidoglycan-binding domain-containing protein n=1 Tax=Streptomyces pyxinae TaxID=2970734 RepID=A0ABT2CKC0_9ACTN|nr:LysM peptidoglycan-binding domain-containing protein [Streptomyces sp. LP05-1]MCS0637865.1 LysM peptidoglycan-binding domain-containing protein [Streptomyces sp. LP05-1]